MITCSVATAKALLKFASSDKNRPNIYGIGITEHGLAATDGFASVEFYLSGISTDGLVGRVIGREPFDVSTKLCAVTKTFLIINPAHLLAEQLTFPILTSVTPEKQSFLPNTELLGSAVNIVPEYLALLHLVTTACETTHVKLSSVKSGSPLRFDIDGPQQSAIVLISIERSYPK